MGHGVETARRPLGYGGSTAVSKPGEAPKVPAKPVSTRAQLGALGAGSKVIHKAFGIGTVTHISGGKIYVSFGGKKERMFLFPVAFER